MKSIIHKPVEGTGYRPDIDGLRAIAVLSVLFFHFDVSGFEGGFVGVDVFFVISGFLITRLIRDNVALGTFSFGTFYVRRARRLFPAMFFTLIVTFLVASLLFSPQHLERLGGSTLYALLSISNFYFWGESGYFDANAVVKPLLHFWSLSVEEQFYFIWPSVLVVLLTRFRQKYIPALFISITGLVSLVAAQKWLTIDASAAFFLLPFRVVEFAFGALLVWLIEFRTKKNLPHEIILALGLLLIFYSIVFFNKQTPFPGVNALIPCLGTALAIYSGNCRFLGRLLTNKAMVFVGLISYSLYLCHWPIYVFYRYLSPNAPIEAVDVFWLVSASLLVATFMYRFVEVPFRFVPKHKVTAGTSARFGLTCALLALVLVFPAAHSWANNGWFWRFGNQNLEEIFDLDQYRAESIRFNQENVLGASFKRGVKKILVVGDSHARDVSNGLASALDSQEHLVRMLTLDDACIKFLGKDGAIQFNKLLDNPRGCSTQLQTYKESPKVQQADIIVFSAGFNPNSAKIFDRFIKFSRTLSGKPSQKIVVMDRTVSFAGFHPEAIRLMSNGVSFQEVNRTTLRFANEPLLVDVYRALEQGTAGFDELVLVSKKDILCGAESCSFFLENGQLAIWDDTHWTVAGARTFMAELIENQPDLFY